jgi:capsular polysaccharide biosynthesis protein
LEKAEIWHGTVLLSDGDFINQDKTNHPSKIPGRMTPCSVWSDIRLESPSANLVSPHAKNEIATIDSGLFINASLSFYHFISESLRPLIQTLESQIEVSNIVIRNDLPFQFYEFVRFLSPQSVQILIGRGEKVIATNILVGAIEDRLSLTNKVFSEYSLEDLRMSDEWRVWSYLRGLSNVTTLRNEILYLPRQKFESRGIQNSVSLEKSLSKNGFEVFDTSKVDFYSQYLHFNNSKLVCSTSGASLANMIFMPPGSTLLEITYPFGHSWKFLAELCGIQHVNFPISSPRPKRLENTLDTYYVNKKKLNRLIDTIVQ